jgi:chromosome segregation ATPase
MTGKEISGPKSKQKALNSGASLFAQIESLEQRRVNLMTNISTSENKLVRLEETLVHYKEQLDELSLLSEVSKEALERLMGEYNLTQAEILETKSALLRQQITNLQKKMIG